MSDDCCGNELVLRFDLAARLVKRLTKLTTRAVGYVITQLQKHWFRHVGSYRYVKALRGATTSALPSGGRLIVDVSVISRHDAGTGIQRVVRAIAFHLADAGDEAARPVLFVETRGRRHFRIELVDGGYRATGEKLIYRAGDLFLGLDFSLDSLWRMRAELAQMRRDGVGFWYLVHDFLPLTQAHWFSAPTVLRFANWLAIMAGTADGFFCVSPPVARELPIILAKRFDIVDCPPVVVIPLGWDLAGSRPSRGLPAEFDDLLRQLAGGPVLLQVGTIEPRKGHRDSLAALEHLWRQGSPVRLLLVGDTGWKMDDFIAMLKSHPEFGGRLFWTGRISDEALESLYAMCTGMIFPSFAEGFGLPVIEALAHGKPVLARRLEVLEPLSGRGVTLFDADLDAAGLASVIDGWIGSAGKTPPIPMISPPTWRDTTTFMLRAIE